MITPAYTHFDMSVIPNVLAERYASAAMKSIWSAEGRIILEREFWIAVMKAQKDLGLDIPDKGKIEVISDRKISAVFQEDRLCENLSAASNIRLVCTETIDYILKKTEGKTLIFVTHEEQEAVWLKADKTLKFMKDHLIK